MNEQVSGNIVAMVANERLSKVLKNLGHEK
jgi:hypothetical protein